MVRFRISPLVTCVNKLYSKYVTKLLKIVESTAITFDLTQQIRLRYINLTERQTGRQTDGRTDDLR